MKELPDLNTIVPLLATTSGGGKLPVLWNRTNTDLQVKDSGFILTFSH